MNAPLPRTRVMRAGVAAMIGAAQTTEAVRRFGAAGARALGHAPPRGADLMRLLWSVPPRDRDVWVDELLGFDEVPPDVPDLPRGAVPYFPAGVEEILALVREAPLLADDALVDLGSGLGRVVILAGLLSGARAHGVEIQAPLVELARARCEALGLDDATFAHADAADVELKGTVFFLYAPFNGPTLTRVERRLDDLARRRRVVVCAVGMELPGAAHLRARASSCASVVFYDGVGA